MIDLPIVFSILTDANLNIATNHSYKSVVITLINAVKQNVFDLLSPDKSNMNLLPLTVTCEHNS